VEVPYAEATDSYNKHSIERAVKHIRALSQPTSKIGIFGLAYKPGTHFAEESPGVLIAKSLQQLQYSLLVYEPEGYSHAEGLLGQTLEYSSSLKEAVDKSDVILVTYPHTQFSTIPTLVKEQHTKKIIIDPWRLFNPADFGELIHYFPFGIGL
jgi:UDPglucose 6-dehydrogenase